MTTGVGGPVAAEKGAKCRIAGVGVGRIMSSETGGSVEAEYISRDAKVLSSREAEALGNCKETVGWSAWGTGWSWC